LMDVKRTEIRSSFMECLSPYKNVIEHIDALIFWEKPINSAMFLFAVQILIWIIGEILESFSLISLFGMCLGAWILYLKYQRFPARLQPLSPLPPDVVNRRHDFDDIVTSISNIYILVTERACSVKHEIEDTVGFSAIMKYISLAFGVIIIGAIIPLVPLLHVITFIFICKPGIQIHRPHDKKYITNACLFSNLI